MLQFLGEGDRIEPAAFPPQPHLAELGVDHDAPAARLPTENSLDEPDASGARDSLHAQGGPGRVSASLAWFFRRGHQIAQPLVIAVLEGERFHRRQGLAGFQIVELGQALVVDESENEAAAGAAKSIVDVAGATGTIPGAAMPAGNLWGEAPPRPFYPAPVRNATSQQLAPLSKKGSTPLNLQARARAAISATARWIR